MKLRKIMSLAVTAAMTMATMSTMANASDYTDVAVTPGTLYRVADNGNGTFKTADNSSSGYSGVIADLSGLTDIADASTVTVEFDTHVIASGGKTPILVFGVGDKAVRGLTANGSSAGNYRTAGLATYFGSQNGTAYNVYGKSTNYATNVANKDVHAKVTLDRVNDTCECELTVGTSKVTAAGIGTVDNLTVIEAITWGATSYNITFKNITVSYTVPETPTPAEGLNVAIASVTANNNPATLQNFIDGNNIVVHVNWYNYTEEEKNIAVVFSYFDADGHFLGYQHRQINGALKVGQSNSDQKITIEATPTKLHGISGNAEGVPAKVAVCLWDGLGDNELIPYCNAVFFEAATE